jgi:PhzF family phenazine biosynthesis protein
MKLRLFQVDAFAERVFEGNPAAVCPLDEWLDDALLQAIAAENNLSETAYVVAEPPGFRLRWFTPEAEVDLCGHATLAAAHVLYTHLGFRGDTLVFATRSGPLQVVRAGSAYRLSLPATLPVTVAAHSVPAVLGSCLGVPPQAVLAAYDYVIVLADEAAVCAAVPDFAALERLGHRGLVITARGDGADFVCRAFYPKLGVKEDPVTGSAFCQLVPYWAERLQRNTLTGIQRSRRGGRIESELRGDRVLLTGSACDYLVGELSI